MFQDTPDFLISWKKKKNQDTFFVIIYAQNSVCDVFVLVLS